MEGGSVLLVLESFGTPFWLVWFNRLRCHRVPRTLKLLIPTKHIFLRVQSDTQELTNEAIGPLEDWRKSLELT